MASFQKYETKKGELWLFKMEMGKDPATGKRKTTTRRGFKRKKDAELAAAKLLQEIDQDNFLKESGTFENVFDEWMAAEEKRLKKSTIYVKKKKFKKHILPHFTKLSIKDITIKQCQDYSDMMAEKLKSYRDYTIQLNLVFKYAKNKEYISRNPMDYIIYPVKEGDHEFELVDRVYWYKNEIKHFTTLAEQEMSFRNFAMFWLYLYTGVRKGELLALMDDDVNSVKETVTINKTLVWLENEYILQKPKTKKSIREISVDKVTLRILKKLMLQNKQLRLAYGNPDVDKLLFIRSDLRPLRLAHPNSVLNAFIKEWKLHPITVHGLRHTHASMLFSAGVSIKDVQARLGHSNIQTTMDIYTHVTEEQAEKAAAMFHSYMES